MRNSSNLSTLVELFLPVLLLLCVSVVEVGGYVFVPKSSRGWPQQNRARYGCSTSTSLKMSIPNPLDTLTSGLASICRLPGGVTASTSTATGILSVTSTAEGGEQQTETDKSDGDQTPRLTRLYDVENSVSCRVVRELITELDLVVENVIPAATNSRVFTDDSYEFKLPEDAHVPRLVVESPGTSSSGEEQVYKGKEEIVAYLESLRIDSPSEASEGEISIPPVVREIGNFAASFLRMGRGSMVSPAAVGAPRPVKPLILYSYEGNQFCRLVREVLTELDIIYELRSAGKESPRRTELSSLTGGSTQCPYLVDPNTDTAMAESADIIGYLYKTYARWTPPNELLQWASNTILPLAKPLFAALTPLQAGSSREDKTDYEADLSQAKQEIETTTSSHPVVVYTYDWSPFSSETIALLDSLGIDYHVESLGAEWIPGLIAKGGSQKRAALLEMTGQSSLPHIFVGGKSIGGLFSGTPGLLPSLEDGSFNRLVSDAEAAMAESATENSTFPSIVESSSKDETATAEGDTKETSTSAMKSSPNSTKIEDELGVFE